MRRILLLATGGTIASVKTEDGLRPGISPEELLRYVPSLFEYAYIDTYEVCNIDSTNMEPKHWSSMSRIIEEKYNSYDGFIICHGTDTMAYTGAALSYMIQNSSKPIVITGSQRPIDMEVTDAKTNLLDSVIYCIDPDSQDVNIVFDGKVIIGTRAKKVRAKSFNAFESFNFPYPAIIQDLRVIRYIPPEQYIGAPVFYHTMDSKVSVLKLTPGMNPSILPFAFEQNDGVVIESFGVGGIPYSITDTFYRLLESCLEKEKVIVMATQVTNEGSNMNVYEVGKKAKETYQLLEAYDMTLEASITKLIWVLSNQNTLKKTYPSLSFQDLYYKKINHDLLHL